MMQYDANRSVHDSYPYIHSFIHSYAHSHSFMHTFIFIHSFIRTYIHIHSYIHSYPFVHSSIFIRTFIHIHSFIPYSFIHAFHSFIMSRSIHPSIHSFIQSTLIHASSCIHASLRSFLSSHSFPLRHGWSLRRLVVLQSCKNQVDLYPELPCLLPPTGRRQGSPWVEDSQILRMIYRHSVCRSICADNSPDWSVDLGNEAVWNGRSSKLDQPSNCRAV